ncbi:hypothetical protein [Roseateles toxinivorans]|nr:hypothetical protein [Roseateles toxinivorans]
MILKTALLAIVGVAGVTGGVFLVQMAAQTVIQAWRAHRARKGA